MESKAKRLREELDELGYYHPFTPESVPLVEKLVSDLKTTTVSLQKYMQLAQNAIEERDNLQVGAEPFRCDNARLVKECNDLHFALLRCREEHEKVQKGLSRQIETLKTQLCDCGLEREKLKKRLKQLELELEDKCEILLSARKKTRSQSTSALKAGKVNRKSTNFELNSAMALADQKISSLTKDIKKLKEHNLQLIEANELLQSQISNRDKEIKRLSGLLEGGRPLQAIKKDCCCTKSSHEGVNAMQEQINSILQEKHDLEHKLKDALAKQHEAMRRALHLADRNKVLEKEMKDIDQLALAVEAECNNTVKNNADKDRMHESVLQIQGLERENSQLKQEKNELRAELDAILVEKRHLQTVLETSLEDKKRLTDRINNFTIIEHDLNMEIDRLTRISAEQRRKIAEMECSIVSDKFQEEPKEPKINPSLPPPRKQSLQTQPSRQETRRLSSPEASPTKLKNSKPKKKVPKKPSIEKSQSSHTKTSQSPINIPIIQQQPPSSAPFLPPPLHNQVPLNTPLFSPESAKTCTCQCHAEVCSSTRHLQELLDKELEFRDQQIHLSLENLRSEKDYYMKEYHKVLEQLRNLPARGRSGSNGDNKASELLQKLTESERFVSQLEYENKALSKEKFDLVSKLEGLKEIRDASTEGPCLKVTCKRTERERDLLRADLERVEEERDLLKHKLKNLSSSQIDDEERLKRRLVEAEEQINKLEQERRELVQSTGSRKATIDSLEERSEALKDQLRLAQNELSQQRALYNQTLHEQTDRTLADTQSKLIQTEGELADALESLKKRELDKGTVSKEVEMLKNDIKIMKGQLAQLDQEKDELLVALDDKTEKLARVDLELKAREKTIASLEVTLNEMKKKLSKTVDESSEQEHLLRSSQTELVSVQQELETVRKIKDSAIQENRRLQDDLCAVTCDCRDARKELELYKRQVDDLKTQLQHYVAEVKRTEDLISNKEIERNEILDQFRSLSHEANVLETNNHTLENEATQSKVQLSVALDHAADLERKLENKQSIIQSYERQIADLTSQIASLELQLRQCVGQFDKGKMDLQDLRDLTMKLEKENARLKRQLRDREDQRFEVDRNVDQLRSERELWQSTASRDRIAAENVEKDLHDAVHETGELRHLNQALQSELQRLKSEIQELKNKFMLTSEQLDMYQEKALEYSQQNKQLRREIANERFRRTRDSESSRYPDKCRCDPPVLKETTEAQNIELTSKNRRNRPKDSFFCYCSLNNHKLQIERRRLSDIQEVQENEDQQSKPTCKCCKNCFLNNEPDDFVANYEVVDGGNGPEMSKMYFKK